MGGSHGITKQSRSIDTSKTVGDYEDKYFRWHRHAEGAVDGELSRLVCKSNLWSAES